MQKKYNKPKLYKFEKFNEKKIRKLLNKESKETLIKMLRSKISYSNRIDYLNEMQKLLSCFNISVARQIILLDRSGLNQAIDQLDNILKNSIRERK